MFRRMVSDLLQSMGFSRVLEAGTNQPSGVA